jgi:SAM-dependent methyltransferase
LHEAAYQYVAQQVARYGPFGRVLEVGGRVINGSIRHLFDCDAYHSVDIEDGDGVDEVADFGTLQVLPAWDCVVCCEVLEHTASALVIIANAYRALLHGGVFIMTCAGERRAEHSAFDGGPLRPGEFYRNVSESQLDGWLEAAGFAWWSIDVTGPDIRCVAGR